MQQKETVLTHSTNYTLHGTKFPATENTDAVVNVPGTLDLLMPRFCAYHLTPTWISPSHKGR